MKCNNKLKDSHIECNAKKIQLKFAEVVVCIRQLHEDQMASMSDETIKAIAHINQLLEIE